MKKHIAILSMLILAFCTVGCTDEDVQSSSDVNSDTSSNSSVDQVENLEKPSGLSLSGRTLTWNEVNGATGYKVDVNNTECEVYTNSYTLQDGVYGILKIRVKAINAVAESEYSV